MNDWDEYLSDDLFEVTEQLRTRRHNPTDLRLDELKRQAMAQANRAPSRRQGRGFFMRSRLVTLMLVLGLLVAGGGAGVIADHKAGDNHTPPASAGHGKYCNSGNGNGFETPPFSGFTGPGNQGDQQSTTPTGAPECDPGNSATHNHDNAKEAAAGPSRFSPSSTSTPSSKKK